jgi:hypothetical protein
MAARLKILMSSGSKKESRYTIVFSPKNLGKQIPFSFSKWGPYGERYLLTGHFYIWDLGAVAP